VAAAADEESERLDDITVVISDDSGGGAAPPCDAHDGAVRSGRWNPEESPTRSAVDPPARPRPEA